jgi:hypothetical protein
MGQRLCLALALLFAGVGPAAGQNVTFKIPVTKIPIKVKEQSFAVAASGVVQLSAKDSGASKFRLELIADLGELQLNMTELLSAQLDKDDACGERIAIQNAQLAPAPPASAATVQLHYERWACAKILGKDKSKKLVGGNAVIEMKLTPAVEQDGTELRLVPEVGRIEADGSLGELLRSGTVGDMIRDKIRAAILSALEKGTNLTATLPPAIQGHVAIRSVEFKDAGAGKLLLTMVGEGQVTREEIQALSKQVKEHVAAK